MEKLRPEALGRSVQGAVGLNRALEQRKLTVKASPAAVPTDT